MPPTRKLTPIAVLVLLSAGSSEQQQSQDDSGDENCPQVATYGPDNGPSTWGDTCPSCNGHSQSPIDIDPDQAVTETLPKLRGKFLDNETLFEKSVFLARNYGDTLGVRIRPTQEYYLWLTGGPLGARYVMQRVEFHWGSNDSVGSEHTFKGQRYPLEAQWIFHRSGLDYEKALRTPGGILRLVQLFPIEDEENPSISAIEGALQCVVRPGVNFGTGMFCIHRTLLTNYSFDDYYWYNGSNTKPPCTEGQIYLVYPPGPPISREQLKYFRELQTAEGKPLVDNFRPLQPLNGRRLVKSDKNSGLYEQQQQQQQQRQQHKQQRKRQQQQQQRQGAQVARGKSKWSSRNYCKTSPHRDCTMSYQPDESAFGLTRRGQHH